MDGRKDVDAVHRRPAKAASDRTARLARHRRASCSHSAFPANTRFSGCLFPDRPSRFGAACSHPPCADAACRRDAVVRKLHGLGSPKHNECACSARMEMGTEAAAQMVVGLPYPPCVRCARRSNAPRIQLNGGRCVPWKCGSDGAGKWWKVGWVGGVMGRGSTAEDAISVCAAARGGGSAVARVTDALARRSLPLQPNALMYGKKGGAG